MTTRNYGLIRTAAEFVEFARRLMQSDEVIGFDIEAGYTGPDKEGVSLLPHHPDWLLVGFSFTNSRDWARYVPIAHDNGDNVDNVPAVARVLWRLLNAGKVVPHNANYELTGVSRFFMETLGDDPKVGDEVRKAKGFFPIYSDSYIEAKMLNQYDPLRVGAGLKGLSKHVLGQEMTEFRDLFPVEDTDMGPGTPKNKLKYIRFNTRYPDSPRIINYTCEDATAAWELSARHRPLLTQTGDEEQKRTYALYRIEMLLLPILVAMEKEGLVLDWPEIHKRAEEIKRFGLLYNEQIQRDFSKRTGRTEPVLLSSPKQLADVLFAPIEQKGLGLPVKKRSDKTQQPSTGDDALAVIAQTDPIIRDILTWRRVDKLYGSYLGKYDTQLNYAGNGRAYPNHNQIGAGTGRMSVDGVPYQQWPKPYHFELKDGTSFDLNFRDLLIAPEGSRIIGFDYSQIELRVLAGQAGEDAMIEAFVNDIDIHKATASTMLRVPLDQVTKIERAKGKTINFGIVYGQGAEALAEGISAAGEPTTKAEAEALLNEYFKGFPKLRAYMDGLVRTGSEQGYVMTPFGRKFTIWEYQSPLPYVRSKGDRLCVNAPIQGGAADYMKIGMVRAWNAIQKAGLGDKIRLVMSIHDALEFYVDNSISTQEVIDLLDPMVAFSHEVMGGVPIRADWHEGVRWGHVVEVKRDRATGKITGYVNEDDDQVFDTPEGAYARGEELDRIKAEKYRVAINERVERERLAAEAEAAEEAERAASAPEPTFPEDAPETLEARFDRFQVQPDMREAIRAAMYEGADTPAEEVKIEMSRLGLFDATRVPGIAPAPAKQDSDDLFADIDALLTPEPAAPAESAPATADEPDDTPMALTEYDAAAEAWSDKTLADESAKESHKKAAERTKVSIALKRAGINREQLRGTYFQRYHDEAQPGETPDEWIVRVGLTAEEVVDPEEVPEWAHVPRPDPAAQPKMTLTEAFEAAADEEEAAAAFDPATHEEVYTLTVSEMPDSDTFDVAIAWLKKVDTYTPTRVILATPEGEVELGHHGVGFKEDAQMTKIARLLGGEWASAVREKIPA